MLIGQEIRNKDGGPAGVLNKVYKELKKTGFFVKLYTVKKNRKIYSLIKILYTISINKFDIINVHSGNFICYILSFLPSKYKRKMLLTQHGYPKFERNMKKLKLFIHSLLTTLSLKRSFNISFVSNIFKEKVIEDINVLKANIYITPNGLDNNICTYEKDNIDKNKNYIIFIGGSRWVKGFDIFMQALLNANISYKIRIFGSRGNVHNVYTANLDNLKRKHDIEFKGIVKKEVIYNELQKSTFCIIPSRFDAFNVVVLEAMYFKNIVFVSKFAGASEVIRNNENGFVIDPVDLEYYINNLYKYNDERISNNAYETAKKYLWENNIYNYIRAFENIYNNS